MAGKISNEFIEELRNRNDIVSVISPYVELKKQGRLYKGLCPFHNEKTPSFTVYPETQSFFCFGCGAGGEIINFVRRIENLDFIDAVKSIADKCGMRMPEDGFDDSLILKRKRMYAMNKEAGRFFHSQLLLHEGRKCLEYYLSRGYTRETIRHFGLGYSPDSWDSLLRHLRNLGYSYEEIYEANLANKSTKNGRTRYYDNFRGRAMVPIIDATGRVVAFGGRVLDDSKPKYVNTSDTLVYKKSLGVFGLNYAKKNNEKKLMLVEGYMDVIALHQAGFTNSVAALGTAFTKEMALLLSRYADQIYLCFDNDEAGAKATQKAIDVFSSNGLQVKVIKMSGGKDPDEILKKYGPEEFKKFISGAANDVEYKILEEQKKYNIDSPDGKMRFALAATKIIADYCDPIGADVYATKLSNELDIGKDVLMSSIRSSMNSKRYRDRKANYEKISTTVSSLADKVNPEKKNALKAANAEESLVVSLIKNPEYFDSIKDKISAADFVTEFNRRIFITIKEYNEKSDELTLSSFGNEGYEVDEVAYINEMVLKRNICSTIEECLHLIETIKSEKSTLSLKNIDIKNLTDEEFLNLFKRKGSKNGNQ